MSEILGTLFKYMLALLGVGAVVLVLYQVLGNDKTGRATADLTQLQTQTQTMFNGQSTFTNLSNAVAIAGKLAPPGMIAGTALVNPWGGTVTTNINGANQSRFDIAETLVPADACAKMVVNTSAMVALSINGTAATLPMDASNAVTSCTATNNTITFTFGR